MYRHSISRAVRPALRSSLQTRAAFSTSIRAMAGGDTGAPRTGGVASGDAFTKREQAQENYAIREREKEKLLELKKKIAEQRDHLDKLSDHIDELSKEQGGEQK